MGDNEFWTPDQKANLDFFKQKLPALLTDPIYKNKFVIIHQQELNGFYDSFEMALTVAVSKFPKHEFVIQQVISEDENINFLFSATTKQFVGV